MANRSLFMETGIWQTHVWLNYLIATCRVEMTNTKQRTDNLRCKNRKLKSC